MKKAGFDLYQAYLFRLYQNGQCKIPFTPSTEHALYLAGLVTKLLENIRKLHAESKKMPETN